VARIAVDGTQCSTGIRVLIGRGDLHLNEVFHAFDACLGEPKKPEDISRNTATKLRA
jgi:hypothetical protein